MLKDIGLNEAIMAPELTKGVGMLMYGKEVSNRKRKIDRQQIVCSDGLYRVNIYSASRPKQLFYKECDF